MPTTTNQISAINIGGTKYDIIASGGTANVALDASALGGVTATSITASAANGQSAYNWLTANTTGTSAKNAENAGAAGKLSAARTISAGGDVSWTVSFDGSSNATANASITNVPWSAASGLSNSTITTAQSTGFASPSAVAKAINDGIAGVYKVKGTKTVAQINALTDMESGDVWNVSDSGTINGQSVLPGDNVVYVSASTTEKGWDKLAASIDTSNFAVQTGAYTASNQLSAYSAVNAGSADNASKLGNVAAASVTGSASSGAAASAAIAAALTASGDLTAAGNSTKLVQAGAITSYVEDKVNETISETIDIASSITTTTQNSAIPNVGAVTAYIDNNKQNAYGIINVKPSGAAAVVATTATAAQDTIYFKAGTNVQLVATGTEGHPTIEIQAKDTTYTSLNGINSTEYNALTAVSGLTAEATSSKAGITKASYVSEGVAYIF